MTGSPDPGHDRLTPRAARAPWSASRSRGQGAGARLTAVVAMTAVAGGVHLGAGLRHDLAADRHGALLVLIGMAQAALALALHRHRSRPWLAAVVAVNAVVTVAWLLTYIPSDAGGGDIGPAGVVVTTVQVIAVVLARAVQPRPIPDPAPPTLRSAALARKAAVVAAVVAVAGVTAASGTTGHGHHHDELPTLTAASVAEPRPIFGDLFADHHHDPPAVAAGDHPESDEHAEPDEH